MLTKIPKQSKIPLASEGADFLFCRQKPFSMREETPFLHLHAERGLFVLEDKMKICYQCKNIKSLSEFHRNKTKKDNHTTLCKDCTKLQRAERKKKFNGLHNVWANMKSRCNNFKTTRYERYGGRGITICQKWQKSFLSFYNWAKDKHRKGLTIDRRDNNGNYTPENCRFVTLTENLRNTSRVKLNTEKVKRIRELLKEGKLFQREIGEMFDVPSTTISGIKLGKRWGWFM